MSTYLFIIDPQNDFCMPEGNQYNIQAGSLFVPGADQDMHRLAKFINRYSSQITNLIVSLDTHSPLHIATCESWLDAEGNHPTPFTIIEDEDIDNGLFRPLPPIDTEWALSYTRKLQENGRYSLCLWPQHCVIGTMGAAVYPEVTASLNQWQLKNRQSITFLSKGMNARTEHYSVIKADVVDESDPSTLENLSLINQLKSDDVTEILITGEALSHCVANTVIDLVDSMGNGFAKKLVLLSDTCSSVPGFEELGNNFLSGMKAKGMRVTTTTEYLA